MITKTKKSELIAKFGKSAKNTGHSSVQIALLTERIRSLSDHIKSHRKDYTSQRGLLKLVGQRRRLLNYLKRNDLTEYGKILQQLELRK
jgi:small subunit ribosomal protein S15